MERVVGLLLDLAEPFAEAVAVEVVAERERSGLHGDLGDAVRNDVVHLPGDAGALGRPSLGEPQLLLELGARHTVGTGTPDAAALERTIHYDFFQHEVLRWLEVAGLAGAAPVVLEPALAATAAERAAAEAVLGAGRGRADR